MIWKLPLTLDEIIKLDEAGNKLLIYPKNRFDHMRKKIDLKSKGD